jgi:hypothetical protein
MPFSTSWKEEPDNRDKPGVRVFFPHLASPLAIRVSKAIRGGTDTFS